MRNTLHVVELREQGDRVRIHAFSDRIEVHSRDGLGGPMRLDSLLSKRWSRNATLVQGLVALEIIEGLGFGLDRMVAAMAEAGLPAPVFANHGDTFAVTLYGAGRRSSRCWGRNWHRHGRAWRPWCARPMSGTPLVIGDWQRKRYCFVEFEDATQSSISVRRARQTSAWSTRFLAGYSQVMDWLWLLEAMRDTDPFERQFGKRSIAMAGLLVIGRDRGITVADRRRLEWRRDNVVVGSKHIYCCTFDELVHDLRQRLDTWPITPPSG